MPKNYGSKRIDVGSPELPHWRSQERSDCHMCHDMTLLVIARDVP